MILKKLVPGKAIGAQPHFVETFNALVDFVLNLKGDKDVNDSTGTIEVDRSDVAHPVIRADKLAIGGDAPPPDDVSTEVYQHEGESTPSEAEAAAEGKLQIKGWVEGEPHADNSLAEILSGREVTGEMSPSFNRDAYIIVRCTDGSLAYVQIGKVLTDGASVEFKSDSTTGNLFLQLKDWSSPSSYGANATIAKFLEGKQQFNHTLLVPVRNSFTGAVGYVDIGQLSGTGIKVGTPKTVVTGFEWVDSSHDDFAQHPYTFKISRGNLSISGGKLSVVADPSLTTYIGTTPLSQEASSS